MIQIERKRNEALLARSVGDISRAISLQLEVYNTTKQYSDLKLVTKFVIINNDFKGGKAFLGLVDQQFPDIADADLDEMNALCFMRCEEFDKALPYLKKTLLSNPHQYNVHDGLSELYHRLDRPEESKKHGSISLELKAQENISPLLSDLSSIQVPKFSSEPPSKNIISFSLFGQNPMYFEGAYANIKEANKIFPEWTCRFYIAQSVPENVTKKLNKLGAQTISIPEEGPAYKGLFWRFKVCSDPSVERYLIRDADSLVTSRERAAVDEWINSPYHFHIMRDFATHTELILAGLWGGVKDALPNFEIYIQKYIQQKKPSKFMDQQFLRQKAWSTISSSCLIHDSRHRLDNTCDFPEGHTLSDGKYVGVNFDRF